jgi:high affinity Mn2+ porin
LWKNASVFFNPELAGGEGLSQTLGIAGATNGETFRIGNPKPAIYLARGFIQQVLPIYSDDTREIPKDIDHFKNEDFNQLSEFFTRPLYQHSYWKNFYC